MFVNVFVLFANRLHHLTCVWPRVTGINNVLERFPLVRIVTTMVDECLNEDKVIVPGLGDFGDRFGSCVDK